MIFLIMKIDIAKLNITDSRTVCYHPETYVYTEDKALDITLGSYKHKVKRYKSATFIEPSFQTGFNYIYITGGLGIDTIPNPDEYDEYPTYKYQLIPRLENK